MPLRLYIFFVLSCALYAQSGVPVGSPGSLQGRVTDSQTGNGIGGAGLHLVPAGGVKSKKRAVL